jgi:hypothetical protein
MLSLKELGEFLIIEKNLPVNTLSIPSINIHRLNTQLKQYDHPLRAIWNKGNKICPIS